MALIENPIKFRHSGGGGIAFGYPATILADICDVVLAARQAGELQKQQEHIAQQCEILVRGFARVGIIALVDEATGLPVPDGEVGTLAMTALCNNNITPFLRWNSGDLISMRSKGYGSGPWSMFPVMHHARRTVGFFKVRGVNINHNELEDLMFFNQAIQDFKAEVVATDEGNDLLRLLVEPRRGLDIGEVGRGIVAGVQKTFEMTPEIVILEAGTLGKEFESTIKAARFVDRRG